MKKRIYYKVTNKDFKFFSVKSKKLVIDKNIDDYPLIDTLIFLNKKALSKWITKNNKNDYDIKKCIRTKRGLYEIR